MEVLNKWQQLISYMGDTCVAIDHETARNTYFATGDNSTANAIPIAIITVKILFVIFLLSSFKS